MRALNPRERRLVALGLLALTIGLVWLAIVEPLAGGFLARAEARRNLRLTYLRDEHLIQALPAVRASVETQRRTASRFGLTAPNEALAAEALKQRIMGLSTQEGFAVNAIEDLQADAPEGGVKLRADLTLSLTQLDETIRRLQSEDAYVVIDDISITADRSLAVGRLAPIDARVELSADWRPAQGRSG